MGLAPIEEKKDDPMVDFADEDQISSHSDKDKKNRKSQSPTESQVLAEIAAQGLNLNKK